MATSGEINRTIYWARHAPQVISQTWDHHRTPGPTNWWAAGGTSQTALTADAPVCPLVSINNKKKTECFTNARLNPEIYGTCI